MYHRCANVGTDRELQLFDSLAYDNISYFNVRKGTYFVFIKLVKFKKNAKKIEYVARYVNFAYNCRKFPNIIMAKQNTTKKHIVTSFHNLAPELQEAVKQKYPLRVRESDDGINTQRRFFLCRTVGYNGLHG